MRHELLVSCAFVSALCAVACNGSADATTSSGSGGSGGSSAGLPAPDAQFVPKPTAACPEFATGTASFSPDGTARPVEIWVSDKAKELDGPLVFFWHGAGGSPTEATYALDDAIAAILDLGGVVAAPHHDPDSGSLPWYLSLGGVREDDLRVADEVLACAVEKVGVDLRRVHSVGFSAGAMHNTQFVARRSGYLASIVNYSGARLGTPTEQDGANKYPAMLFHGGANDKVIIQFAQASQDYHDALSMAGHFSFLCDHGLGHTVPANGRASAWQFLQDHPFRMAPEPYEKALPAGFPTYCAL